MNQTQTDKEFALIVEDFYEDYETTVDFHSARRSGVSYWRLAGIIISTMLIMVSAAYCIENPMAIPAAIVITVGILTYRAMVKEQSGKSRR